MRPQVPMAIALVAGAAACDPCHVGSLEGGEQADYYDEVWAHNGHNLLVQVMPDRMPFDVLLDAMEPIDASFRCFSEDEQRGFTEEDCYRLKLPRDVCWRDAAWHFNNTYAEGFRRLAVSRLAEPPEDRCDCTAYHLPTWN